MILSSYTSMQGFPLSWLELFHRAHFEQSATPNLILKRLGSFVLQASHPIEYVVSGVNRKTYLTDYCQTQLSLFHFQNVFILKEMLTKNVKKNCRNSFLSKNNWKCCQVRLWICNKRKTTLVTEMPLCKV